MAEMHNYVVVWLKMHNYVVVWLKMHNYMVVWLKMHNYVVVWLKMHNYMVIWLKMHILSNIPCKKQPTSLIHCRVGNITGKEAITGRSRVPINRAELPPPACLTLLQCSKLVGVILPVISHSTIPPRV